MKKPLFSVGEKWENEWQGMPEFIQNDVTAYQQIIVNLANKEDVKKFEKLIGRSLTYKTKSIWYPDVPNANFKKLAYQNEE